MHTIRSSNILHPGLFPEAFECCRSYILPENLNSFQLPIILQHLILAFPLCKVLRTFSTRNGKVCDFSIGFLSKNGTLCPHNKYGPLYNHLAAP